MIHIILLFNLAFISFFFHGFVPILTLLQSTESVALAILITTVWFAFLFMWNLMYTIWHVEICRNVYGHRLIGLSLYREYIRKMAERKYWNTHNRTVFKTVYFLVLFQFEILHSSCFCFINTNTTTNGLAMRKKNNSPTKRTHQRVRARKKLS